MIKLYKVTKRPNKIIEKICGIDFKMWNIEVNKKAVKAERWYYDN